MVIVQEGESYFVHGKCCLLRQHKQRIQNSFRRMVSYDEK